MDRVVYFESEWILGTGKDTPQKLEDFLMRCRLVIFAIAGLLAGMASDVVSETVWDISGQVRLREQADDKSFVAHRGAFTFYEIRTRAAVGAVIEDNTHVFVQIQDSRIAGDVNQFGERTSGTLNDSKNVDLHQAFVKIDNIFGEGWGGLGGRFEYNRGNQRVFGGVGWHNIGRSFEGAMLWYHRPTFRIELFNMYLREMQTPCDEEDFMLGGIYANVTDWNLDLFAFIEFDRRNSGFPATANDLERLNIGTYYQRTSGDFDVELNGVYQVGEKSDPSRAALQEPLDISAFMFTFEGGFSFAGERNARVAAGIDYSSGDDDPTDNEVNTYQNSYYTGHKFRGHMDYFITSGAAGLVDIILRGQVDPLRGWTLKGDLHFFTTAADYVSPIDGATTKDVGVEFDLSVSTTRVAGVLLQVGISVFAPSEDFAGFADPDPGVWTYSMATANF